MHETDADLDDIQALLDSSRRGAGAHLRDVFADELALSARELADHLTGVRILAMATVSSAGRPIVAPIDAVFYRGRFHVGSAPGAVRVRHLFARPDVSATYLEGERLAVVLHGQAVRLDLDDPGQAGFRGCIDEVYGPRFGHDWLDWARTNAVYFRIEPRRLFASRLPGADATAADGV